MTTFVVATANPDKAREIVEILGDAAHLLPRPDHVPEVEETGSSLLENAVLKAKALADTTGMPAIADDTGLEVDALGGAPGVRSARFAGEGATYADNVRRLLRELEGVAEPRRACFRTVAVARWPNGEELKAEGRIEGTITTEPRGAGGFGYDPVFCPNESGGLTFAQMPPAEKNRLSHRGLAFRALADMLRDVERKTG